MATLQLPPGACAEQHRERGPIVGVLGGAFDPIHLGHVLLAVTVKETKSVDEVVLVPVYKHPVKKDLLPFEHRVAMCELAVSGKGIKVSTVEQETGESNVAMLRALRSKYPPGVQLLWVCGDDVFEWIDNPKGQAMMQELDGLIVQRRLHRDSGSAGKDRFFKAPVDAARIEAVSMRHGLRIDFLFAELPHFSSTLVRSSPASWRAYLPYSVANYLDQHPALLRRWAARAGAEQVAGRSAEQEESGELATKRQRTAEAEDDEVAGVSAQGELGPLTPPVVSSADAAGGASAMEAQLRELTTLCALRCLAVVHSLQRERSRSAMALALRTGAAAEALVVTRRSTDALLLDLPRLPASPCAAYGMAEELARTAAWLGRDRAVLDGYLAAEAQADATPKGWLMRASLVKKYHARIDVLLEACVQTLSEQILCDHAGRGRGHPEAADNPQAEGDNSWSWWSHEGSAPDVDAESHPERLLHLFRLWVRGKEALGRERAFVAAGGGRARELVRSSLRLRTLLNEVIDHKARMLDRIFSVEATSHELRQREMSAHATVLQVSLTKVTSMEWSLMGCFAQSTPLQVIHRMLAPGGEAASTAKHTATFDVEEWFQATSMPIDLMLTLVQSLAAAICASAAQQHASSP